MIDLTLPLRTVKLHGILRSKFGREYKLAVKSVAEAVHALGVMLPGFNKFLMESKDRGLGFAVFVKKNNITQEELTMDSTGEIRIAPILLASKNGGIFNIILGVALVVVGSMFTVFTAGISAGLVNLGIGLIIGGVVQLISPHPKDKKSKDKEDPNYAFNGPVNTIAQGYPVPVLYGEMITGSAVISAGLSLGIPAVAEAGVYAFGLTGDYDGTHGEFRYTEDGDNFTDTDVLSLSGTNNLRHCAVSGSAVTAYGSDGYFHYSPDKGATWTRGPHITTDLGVPAGLVCMDGDNAGHVVGVCGNMGYHPTVYFVESFDGGQTWALAATYPSWYNVSDIKYGGGKWVLGSDSGKLWSANGTSSWHGPFGAAGFKVNYTGTHWLSMYTTPQWSTDCETWNSMTSPAGGGGGANICGDGAGPWYVNCPGSGTKGIYKTVDQGANWTLQVSTGTLLYESKCFGNLVVFADGGGGSSWSSHSTFDAGANWHTENFGSGPALGIAIFRP